MFVTLLFYIFFYILYFISRWCSSVGISGSSDCDWTKRSCSATNKCWKTFDATCCTQWSNNVALCCTRSSSTNLSVRNLKLTTSKRKLRAKRKMADKNKENVENFHFKSISAFCFKNVFLFSLFNYSFFCHSISFFFLSLFFFNDFHLLAKLITKERTLIVFRCCFWNSLNDKLFYSRFLFILFFFHSFFVHIMPPKIICFGYFVALGIHFCFVFIHRIHFLIRAKNSGSIKCCFYLKIIYITWIP